MTPDASVIVAAFASWHERHDDAREAARSATALVAHAELEAYSVLTRLPPPFRAPAPIVATYLERQYPGARCALDAEGRERLVGRLSGLGLSGGAVYDALIGLVAAAGGLTLVTLDHRAAATYRAVDAAFSLL